MNWSTSTVVLVVTAIAMGSVSVSAQSSISAAEAKNHIGETYTVCGRVASTHFAAGSRGNPTFINIDEPYPKEIFTILIWGSDRPKFGDPEDTYRNRRMCVTGKITEYRSVPEIVAHEPSQLKAQ